MEKEFILCAALNYNGTIIAAARHKDCYKVIEELFLNTGMCEREDQGFLTSQNRYVNRKEAWKIAKENNQIKHGLEVSDRGDDSELISENLY